MLNEIITVYAITDDLSALRARQKAEGRRQEV